MRSIHAISPIFANDTIMIYFTGIDSNDYSDAVDRIDFCGANYNRSAALVMKALQGNVFISGSCEKKHPGNWLFSSEANHNVSIFGIRFVLLPNTFTYFSLPSSSIELIFDRCEFYDIARYFKFKTNGDLISNGFVEAKSSNVTITNCFFRQYQVNCSALVQIRGL
jgi:hypothetical protein